MLNKFLEFSGYVMTQTEDLPCETLRLDSSLAPSKLVFRVRVVDAHTRMGF